MVRRHQTLLFLMGLLCCSGNFGIERREVPASKQLERQTCFAFLLAPLGATAASVVCRSSCAAHRTVKGGSTALNIPLSMIRGKDLVVFGQPGRMQGECHGWEKSGILGGRDIGPSHHLAMYASSAGGGGDVKGKKKWSVRIRNSGDPAVGQAGWRPGDALPGGTRPCNSELQQLAKRGDSNAVAAMLTAMDEAGVARDVYSYNAALNAYCKRGARVPRQALESLFEDMQSRGIKPNTVTFNTLLKGAASNGDVAWAASLVDAMRGAGVERDHITFSTMVNACSVAGSIPQAMEVLSEMIGSGIKPTESTLTAVIRGCERAGDLRSAKEAFRHLDQGMSSAVSTAMSDCLTANGRPEEALEILGIDINTIRKGGEVSRLTLDSMRINSAMKAMRSLKDVPGSIGLLKAATLSSLTSCVDFITFNILTDTLCLANQPALARACIDALHTPPSSPPPSLETPTDIIRAASLLAKTQGPHTHQYTSLMQYLGYQDGGDEELDQCFALLDEMCERQVAVDEVVLTTLVDVCAHRGRSARAAEVVGDALARSGMLFARPTTATYNALIKAYRANGQVEEAVGVMRTMGDAGVKPDTVSFNTLLDATLLAGRENDAQKLLQQMRSAGLDPDTKTHNTLIKGYARLKQLPKAMAVLTDMRSMGLEPDERTYSALAEACGNVGDVSRVLEMKQLMDRGAPAAHQQVCREALIKAYAVTRDVDGAEAVAGDMKRDGMQLSSKGVAALMDAYANIGEPYNAMEILQEMEQRGERPNSVHYSILLKAFCNAGILDEAIRVLRHDIKSPDAVCFNVVIHAAIKAKDLDTLVNVLRHMEQSGVAPDDRTREALDEAGSAAASLRLGSVLKTFSKGFNSRLADALAGGGGK